MGSQDPRRGLRPRGAALVSSSLSSHHGLFIERKSAGAVERRQVNGGDTPYWIIIQDQSCHCPPDPWNRLTFPITSSP